MLNISRQENSIARFQFVFFITNLEMVFTFEDIKILILKRMNMQRRSAMGCKTYLFKHNHFPVRVF